MTDQQLKTLYQKQFAPLRTAVAPDVDTKPDPSAATYFSPPIAKENIVEAANFGDNLARHWAARPPALCALAPRIAKLAAELRATEEQSGDVSSLIYPMY